MCTQESANQDALDPAAMMLIADLVKKSGIAWLRFGGRDYPMWLTWLGDAIGVVGGGVEQPLPGLEPHDEATVLLRAKSTRHVVATVQVKAQTVTPDSESWKETAKALQSSRLNAPDRPDMIERWARESTVYRLIPSSPPQIQ